MQMLALAAVGSLVDSSVPIDTAAHYSNMRPFCLGCVHISLHSQHHRYATKSSRPLRTSTKAELHFPFTSLSSLLPPSGFHPACLHVQSKGVGHRQNPWLLARVTRCWPLFLVLSSLAALLFPIACRLIGQSCLYQSITLCSGRVAHVAWSCPAAI
jgi:hypothetical protein